MGAKNNAALELSRASLYQKSTAMLSRWPLLILFFQWKPKKHCAKLPASLHGSKGSGAKYTDCWRLQWILEWSIKTLAARDWGGGSFG